MTEFLWKIILWLRKSIVGEKVADAIVNSKLSIWYNDLQYDKEAKNPTEEMQATRRFFEENKERVNVMADVLEDADSKRIFLAEIKYRFTHDKHDRPEYNRGNQYFPRDVVKLIPEEVFVDCGAYNGDSVRSFLKYANYKYKKIVAFEPDEDNVNQIKKMCAGNVLEILKFATWNENTTIYFSDGAGSGSKVEAGGTIAIPARAIDLTPECSDATFIKMDIEGSEYNALLGAKETIAKNKPILAICIYHSNEDMIRIFELINGWNLGYKFYVRQHAQKTAETVLYAVSPKRAIL